MDLDDPYLPKGNTRYIPEECALACSITRNLLNEGRAAMIQQVRSSYPYHVRMVIFGVCVPWSTFILWSGVVFMH